MASWELVQLTTVRRPLAEMARTWVDLLAQRLAFPTSPIQQLVLPSLLVRRQTAAAPPRRATGSPAGRRPAAPSNEDAVDG